MTAFTDAYVKMLIPQYADQPNAVAEMTAKAASWEKIKLALEAIPAAYDVDFALGKQLSIIGDLVGLPREHIEFEDDEDYRFYIKVKIAKNTGAAYMIRPDTKNSIQDVINFAFDGHAYVVDNYDMTMTLVMDEAVDLTRLQVLIDFDLLPRPQGVRYKEYKQDILEAFGFASNPNSRGFASRTDPSRTGGVFARRVI